MLAPLSAELSAYRELAENLDALAEVHPEAANISLDVATETDPVEVHPGAQRYFDEVG